MTLLNSIIIVSYFAGLYLWGKYLGGKPKSTYDYFVSSGKIPWWAVAFSIVAAETSSLTYISVPGLAYFGNLNFLQIVIGFVIGRIIVANFFLPAYNSGTLTTSYQLLGIAYGPKIQKTSSIIFILTRIAADGVRLFATAIPIKLITGLSYETTIVVLGIISIIYSNISGIKGLIWIDFVQMLIYIGGAAGIILFISYIETPLGFGGIYKICSENNKLELFNFSNIFNLSDIVKNPNNFFSSIFGGIFLSLASHGTEQFVVQRLLVLKEIRNSKKALYLNSFVIFVQFCLFLFIGLAIYSFMMYTNNNGINLKSDEILPFFIIKYLPDGFSGFIIAGIVAAALSSVAASINSVSSSLVNDLGISRLFKKGFNEIHIARITSVFWATLLMISALFFINSGKTIIEIALSISSFTYGIILGLFILAILRKKFQTSTVWFAIVISIVLLSIVVLSNLTAWTWYCFIGIIITVVSTYTIDKCSTTC